LGQTDMVSLLLVRQPAIYKTLFLTQTKSGLPSVASYFQQLSFHHSVFRLSYF